MLEVALKGGKGISLVFPGTAMGADLVIAARRPDDRTTSAGVPIEGPDGRSVRRPDVSGRFVTARAETCEPRASSAVDACDGLARQGCGSA